MNEAPQAARFRAFELQMGPRCRSLGVGCERRGPLTYRTTVYFWAMATSRQLYLAWGKGFGVVHSQLSAHGVFHRPIRLGRWNLGVYSRIIGRTRGTCGGSVEYTFLVGNMLVRGSAHVGLGVFERSVIAVGVCVLGSLVVGW